MAVGSGESVDIDLNGFTLTANAANNVIEASNVGSVRVFGGTLTSFGGVAIYVADSGKAVVENVVVEASAANTNHWGVKFDRVLDITVRHSQFGRNGLPLRCFEIDGDPANYTIGSIERNGVWSKNSIDATRAYRGRCRGALIGGMVL